MDVKEVNPKCIPGTAKIKSQYIITNHVRQLNLDFVAEGDKQETSSIEKKYLIEEPPLKKLKGQNKNRPRMVKIPKCEKLCFKISTGTFCPYGSTCSYSHDISSYLARKLPDIAEDCYLFSTFGLCPYGYSCRFGSKHLCNDKNVCNDSIWNEMKNQRFVKNSLSRELQQNLRTRKYDFTKSEKALKLIQNGEFRNILKRNSEEYEKTDLTSSDNENGPSNISTCNVPETVPIIDVHDENVLLHPIKENLGIIQNSELDERNIENLHGVPVASNCYGKSCETIIDDIVYSLPDQVKNVDFKGKLYLAPLTTVGNLPFRRVCKELGADITCSEMAMAVNLLQGQQSEWALLKRHHTEDIYGVQLCGAHSDIMTRCTQLLNEHTSLDFIDINMGCPLDFVCKKGSGCGLMSRIKKLEEIIYGASSVSSVPITLKMRTGIRENDNLADSLIRKIHYLHERIGLITIHGRSREQRYTKSANWRYINECSEVSCSIPIFGSGDVLSYEDYNMQLQCTKVSGVMIGRGALIKPWIFKEIKEQRHWDISSSERFDIIKAFVNYGLEHWGSDSEGVEKTRKFLLEWLSFLYRYIPVGVLEYLPQHINERPPPYYGRDFLETLMASPSCADWIKISEMILGPVPDSFSFLPKHKANAYG